MQKIVAGLSIFSAIMILLTIGTIAYYSPIVKQPTKPNQQPKHPGK